MQQIQLMLQVQIRFLSSSLSQCNPLGNCDNLKTMLHHEVTPESEIICQVAKSFASMVTASVGLSASRMEFVAFCMCTMFESMSAPPEAQVWKTMRLQILYRSRLSSSTYTKHLKDPEVFTWDNLACGNISNDSVGMPNVEYPLL